MCPLPQNFEMHPEVMRLALPVADAAGRHDTSLRDMAKAKDVAIMALVKARLAEQAQQLRQMRTQGTLPPNPLALVLDELTLGAWFVG